MQSYRKFLIAFLNLWKSQKRPSRFLGLIDPWMAWNNKHIYVIEMEKMMQAKPKIIRGEVLSFSVFWPLHKFSSKLSKECKSDHSSQLQLAWIEAHCVGWNVTYHKHQVFTSRTMNDRCSSVWFKEFSRHHISKNSIPNLQWIK